MKSYVVIGLGRFGSAVAEQLCLLGNEVMAIDTHPDLIQKIAPSVTTAVTGDARDMGVLRALDVQNMECAIVAVGSDFATNILVTLHLKELGVNNVICKAQNEIQKRALEKIGADRVVIPEREMAVKLAQRLTTSSVLDFIELSPEFGIADLLVLPNWIGKNIAELNFRSSYGLNIIAVKRGREIIVSPKADFIIMQDDVLVVIGRDTDLTKVKHNES